MIDVEELDFKGLQDYAALLGYVAGIDYLLEADLRDLLATPKAMAMARSAVYEGSFFHLKFAMATREIPIHDEPLIEFTDEDVEAFKRLAKAISKFKTYKGSWRYGNE